MEEADSGVCAGNAEDLFSSSASSFRVTSSGLVFEHFLKWPGPLAVMIVTMIGVAGKWTPPHGWRAFGEENKRETRGKRQPTKKKKTKKKKKRRVENTDVHTPLAFFTKYCGYSLVPVISRRYLGGEGRV